MATTTKTILPGLPANFGTQGTGDHSSFERIVLLVQQITCFAWAIEKLLSWRIWTTYRMLPTIPVVRILGEVPAFVHTLLFASSMLLISVLIFKANRRLMAILLALEVFQCILDQNRVQPWEYQYFFIVALFTFYPGNKRILVSSVALVLTSTYFYSGINKLNGGFLQSVWSNLILGQFLHLPAYLRHQAWLFYSGYAAGLLEAILGLGLLFKWAQKRSAILLILMHLVILSIWGPFGLRGYQILWFWNASMIALLYLVFVRSEVDFRPVLANAWKKPVILFWAVLPALSLAGLWPKYLSSNMFSGNTLRMVICIQDLGPHKALMRFSAPSDPACICGGSLKVDLQTWIVRETRVSVNPERRLMLQMQQRLREQYPDCKFSFVISERNNKAPGRTMGGLPK